MASPSMTPRKASTTSRSRWHQWPSKWQNLSLKINISAAFGYRSHLLWQVPDMWWIKGLQIRTYHILLESKFYPHQFPLNDINGLPDPYNDRITEIVLRIAASAIFKMVSMFFKWYRRPSEWWKWLSEWYQWPSEQLPLEWHQWPREWHQWS